MDWTLTHDGITKTLAEWGISGAVITALNQQAGTLIAPMPGDAWADAPFVYEDEVVIRRDGVVFWRGYFIAPRRLIGEDGAEVMACEFRDPWHLLDREPFSRGFSTGLVTVNSTNVELFAEVIPGVSLVRNSIGYELSAIAGAAGVTIGTLPAASSITPPPVTLRSPTCGDALRAVLRKVPDAVTSWAHGSTSSVLHIKQRSQGTSRTVSLASNGVVVSKSIVPRPDLQALGCVVTWVFNTAEGEVDAVVDAAGSTSGPRVLRDTIVLPPPVVIPPQTESVQVISESYDEESAAFWIKYGSLSADADDVLVENVTNSSSMNKVLLGGQIPRWLTFSAHAETATISARLALRVWRDPENHEQGYSVVRRDVSVRIPVTDLSGTYTRTISLGSVTAIDEPVTGIAAAVYAATSALPYEGELKLTEEELTGTVKPSDVLNLTHGRAEWETMNAQVHRVTWDIDAASTTISFGPSSHLSPSEFADMLKEFRRDPPATGLAQRAATPGTATLGEVVGGVAYSPPTAPTAGETPEEFKVVVNEWEFSWKADGGKLTIKKESDVARQLLINLDAATYAECFELHVPGPAEEEVVIKPRPTKICVIEDDELVQKNVLILRSDNVEDLE